MKLGLPFRCWYGDGGFAAIFERNVQKTVAFRSMVMSHAHLSRRRLISLVYEDSGLVVSRGSVFS
jgi:hypothetical protein